VAAVKAAAEKAAAEKVVEEKAAAELAAAEKAAAAKVAAAKAAADDAKCKHGMTLQELAKTWVATVWPRSPEDALAMCVPAIAIAAGLSFETDGKCAGAFNSRSSGAEHGTKGLWQITYGYHDEPAKQAAAVYDIYTSNHTDYGCLSKWCKTSDCGIAKPGIGQDDSPTFKRHLFCQSTWATSKTQFGLAALGGLDAVKSACTAVAPPFPPSPPPPSPSPTPSPAPLASPSPQPTIEAVAPVAEGALVCPHGYAAINTMATDDWCATTCVNGCPKTAQSVCKCAVDMACGLLYFVHIPKTGGTTMYDRLKHSGWGINRLYWGDGPKNHTSEWTADRKAWKRSESWKWVQEKLAEVKPKLIIEAHHGAPGLQYMVEHELKDIACTLKAKGCKLRIITMLREPVERVISSLIYNHRGMPEDQKALNMLRFFAEEQSRYLVAGHSKQWPEAWHQIPKSGFVEEELVKKVQHALSYVHIVGNTKRLDSVVDKVYKMLGTDEKAPVNEKDLNVTPEYNVTPDYLKVLSGRSLSDELRHALLRATQTDRRVYRSYFGNVTERAATAHAAVRGLDEDCL
jgi:hypothetical protein